MSETTDQMAPDTSPGEVSKKSGVRRVNNMPMYILAAALGAFLLVMMLVAADRAAKQNAPAQGREAEKAGSTRRCSPRRSSASRRWRHGRSGLAAHRRRSWRPGRKLRRCLIAQAREPGRAAGPAQRWST
jgi:hypothetical protein